MKSRILLIVFMLNLLGGALFADTAAEQFNNGIVYDAHHLLTGGYAFKHLLTEAIVFDLFNKRRRHFDIDVGFQQSQTDLPHRICDVGLRKAALSAQFFKYCVELVAQ